MKKIFLVIVVVSASIAASAQTQFGLKGGLNLSNITGKDVEDTKMKVGFNFGGFVNLSVSEAFSVQPELLFSNQGAKVDFESVDVAYHLNYLNIPVMAQYKTASGFYAETGPYVGFLLSGKAKAEGESMDIKDNFKSTDFGWGLGLGYKLVSGLGVNARYNIGLAKIPDEADAKASNSVIQIGLTYSFGGK